MSTHHEELIKATIPGFQHNIMKDQLGKTCSDTSRQIPTKTQGIIKNEETLLAEKFSNMEIKHEHPHVTHYHQNMNTTHFEINESAIMQRI